MSRLPTVSVCGGLGIEQARLASFDVVVIATDPEKITAGQERWSVDLENPYFIPYFALICLKRHVGMKRLAVTLECMRE